MSVARTARVFGFAVFLSFFFSFSTAVVCVDEKVATSDHWDQKAAAFSSVWWWRGGVKGINV